MLTPARQKCPAFTYLHSNTGHQIYFPSHPSNPPSLTPSLPPSLDQVFALCDPEGRGYITRDTLSRFCDRRNSVLDSIMSTLDHDKDGKISYDEFREGFEVSGTSDKGPFEIGTISLRRTLV